MGGTDFNQTGQLSKYWAATNGSGEESAQAYIPEMVGNDSCASTATAGNLTVCANATASSTTDPLNLVAGSGGPSAVYAKPSWQSTSITGMPSDGARDLPDLSLFSADGSNKSFLIVCESDADIAGDTGCNLTTFSTTSPFHDFQAVGGTSAAAPSFAGIMAMINQKTLARQGNANVTLYALALAKSATFAGCDAGNTAAPSTCIFHDITGNTSSDNNKPTQNNSVACTGGTLNCSKTTSGGFGVMASGTSPAFLAGTGYDLATGLGSVNVTNLINNWSPAGLTATTITLSSSPTPITGTVGTAVTLSGTVAKTGTATPTGVVVFENAVTGLPADSATLDGSGNYSLSTTFLPAATAAYTLKAHYGGDLNYAPKDSATISVGLTKQGSKVLVSFVTFDASNNPILNTSSQSVQYGSPYILRVDVENNGGTPCENFSTGVVSFVCPTGTVSLLDNNQALKDFPNAQTP